MNINNRLRVRVKAILYDEHGERELFDDTINDIPHLLMQEAAIVSPILKRKILKYLDSLENNKSESGGFK